jgi:hypothetical protein
LTAALNIEVRAQCRLADEYEAAQERGEVKPHGRSKEKVRRENLLPGLKEVGLTKKQAHEARQIRDAEKKNPGAIKKAIEQKLAAGKEPTRAFHVSAWQIKKIDSQREPITNNQRYWSDYQTIAAPDYNADFLVMLKTWEAAEAFIYPRDSAEKSEAIVIARLLGWTRLESGRRGVVFPGERDPAQKSQAIESVFVRFVKRKKRKTLMSRRVFGDPPEKETQPIDIAPKPQPSAPPPAHPHTR